MTTEVGAQWCFYCDREAIHNSAAVAQVFDDQEQYPGVWRPACADCRSDCVSDGMMVRPLRFRLGVSASSAREQLAAQQEKEGSS